MPRLDAFDEEFGREPVAILRGQRRRRRLRLVAVIALLLAAAIVSAFALAWSVADERERPPAPLSTAGRAGGDQQIDRLVREVAALKQEIRGLAQAQQQAAETIAELQAAEQENRQRTSFWYSDPAALTFGLARTFGLASHSEPGIAAAPPRRTAAARPKPRETRRREDSAPLSLEAPQ